MSELVSVIVPIYNVEKYLSRCLDSILAQTYIDFELLLVNDGSTDKSPAICKKYAENDSRITFIDNKENAGQSVVRNIGLFHAKGTYIAFVDSDDYVHKQYIENMYNRLKKDGSDMCLSDFCFVYEGEEDIAATAAEPVNNNYYNSLLSSEEAMKAVANTYHTGPVSKLYKSELYINLRYPEGRIHEDEFVLHYLFARCNSVSFIPDTLYFYFQRMGSTVVGEYSVRRLDVLDAYEDRIKFYFDNDIYGLIKCTYLGYIQRYMEAWIRLNRSDEENKHRWRECAAKFRSHAKNIFLYGGLIIQLRFLLAIISPHLYRVLSEKINASKLMDV